MRYYRLLSLTAVALLIFSIGLVGAQDRPTSNIPENLSGVVTQTANAGSLVDNGDGTHTLTLMDANAFGSWVINTPTFSSALYPTLEFALDWAFDAELTGSAVLQFKSATGIRLDESAEEITLTLSLSNPEYSPEGALTYLAVIDVDALESSGIASEKSGALELPAELNFENAGLVIRLDSAFVNNFLQARLDRFNVRTIGANPCWPLRC